MLDTICLIVFGLIMAAGVAILVMGLVCPQRLFPPVLFGRWKRRSKLSETELAIAKLHEESKAFASHVADSLSPAVEAMKDAMDRIGKIFSDKRSPP